LTNGSFGGYNYRMFKHFKLIWDFLMKYDDMVFGFDTMHNYSEEYRKNGINKR
jgi:hypothetical protein